MSVKENDKWDFDQNPLKEEDRSRILARIHSTLYWLGKFVPEEEMFEGRTVPLRDVFYRYVSNPDPTEEQIKDALELADHMERKARELENDLKTKDGLTKGKAHILLDEICGLLRGVEEVRTATSPDAKLKAKALMQKVDDERRWQEFLKSVAWINSVEH
jgi:hypothetical protein